MCLRVLRHPKATNISSNVLINIALLLERAAAPCKELHSLMPASSYTSTASAKPHDHGANHEDPSSLACGFRTLLLLSYEFMMTLLHLLADYIHLCFVSLLGIH